MRCLNNRLRINFRGSEAAFFHIAQVFPVALGAFNGGIIKAHDSHSHARRKVEYAFDDRKVDGFIAHNSFFSDLLLSGLKLRLYKAHELGAFFQKRTHCRKHELY